MARTSLRSRTNRFFYRNRNKGIRNLMLYIAVGNLVVYVLYLLNRANPIFYYALLFDYEKILSGQVWRLFTYPLVYLVESTPFLGLIGLFFYYWCGTILDQYWGTLRFNFYYLSALLLTDVVAMLVGAAVSTELKAEGLSMAGLISADYINLSLFLAVATILPEQQIRIYFLIPVKMKWLAWLDIGLTLYGMLRSLFSLIHAGVPYVSVYLMILLVPVVPLLNYLLFFGKQAAAILPDFLRYHPTKTSWKREMHQGRIYEASRPRDNARFRCTVCGRTELTNPGLEFRYCSRCAGYRCYCEDHINNHTHITE